MEFGVRINAEQMKDRRGEVAGRECVADGKTGVCISLADDLAGANASAGEEAREDVAPVMSLSTAIESSCLCLAFVLGVLK